MDITFVELVQNTLCAIGIMMLLFAWFDSWGEK